MTALLLFSSFFVGREVAVVTMSGSVKTEEKCIVLDAGHGGADPGKVGINGIEEKHINLEIVRRVKKYLEAADVRVVLTRENDQVPEEGQRKNQKVQDMRRRVDVIESNRPHAVVSIHQNSFPQEAVHGAQVFYYAGSISGQKLASRLQNAVTRYADIGNQRQIKANDSYYLLRRTEVPTVIVECGFLSNREEAMLLVTEDYQNEIANAIVQGIESCFGN
jgi:N-acetylmuramoyl-L-alanine amidase